MSVEEWKSFILTKGEQTFNAVRFFMDPESGVQDLRERLKSIEEQKSQVISQAKLKHTSLLHQREIYKNNLQTLREFYADCAAPVLDDLERDETKKILCEEFKNALATQQETVHNVLASELKGYGYKSRFCHTIGIVLETLREKIDAGVPFQDELVAIRTGLSEFDDMPVKSLCKSLESLAVSGCPTSADLLARYSTLAHVEVQNLSTLANAASETDFHKAMLSNLKEALLFDQPGKSSRTPSSSTVSAATKDTPSCVKEAFEHAKDIEGIAADRWRRQACEYLAGQQFLNVATTMLQMHRYSMVTFLVSDKN
eukprot:PhF_6_TR19620/c0_g1_i1/m.28629